MPDVEQMLAAAAETVTTYEAQCHRCRAGFPLECENWFRDGTSCTVEKRTPQEYLRAQDLIKAVSEITGEKPKRGAGKKAAESTPTPTPNSQFNSGYVDPAVWVFSKSIGDFADPLSTGRKAAAEMYPITGGLICDWAWKTGCGDAVVPIIGCPGHAASDLHHGPDKNTLNNAKLSWGQGSSENIWLLCSFCHNAYHALNDKFYPAYDRIEDQRQPWLPLWPDGFQPFEMTDADPEIILAEEARRKKEHDRHGVKREGRNARHRPADDGAGDEHPADERE